MKEMLAKLEHNHNISVEGYPRYKNVDHLKEMMKVISDILRKGVKK
jgi:hypothetical protein